MDADTMLKNWVAERLGVDAFDIEHIEFVHEDGWSNESGTVWPEENYVKVKIRNKKKKVEFSWGYGAEEIPQLLTEILDANDP
jgi:hypothetical protein